MIPYFWNDPGDFREIIESSINTRGGLVAVLHNCPGEFHHERSCLNRHCRITSDITSYINHSTTSMPSSSGTKSFNPCFHSHVIYVILLFPSFAIRSLKIPYKSTYNSPAPFFLLLSFSPYLTCTLSLWSRVKSWGCFVSFILSSQTVQI